MLIPRLQEAVIHAYIGLKLLIPLLQILSKLDSYSLTHRLYNRLDGQEALDRYCWLCCA